MGNMGAQMSSQTSTELTQGRPTGQTHASQASQDAGLPRAQSVVQAERAWEVTTRAPWREDTLGEFRVQFQQRGCGSKRKKGRSRSKVEDSLLCSSQAWANLTMCEGCSKRSAGEKQISSARGRGLTNQTASQRRWEEVRGGRSKWQVQDSASERYLFFFPWNEKEEESGLRIKRILGGWRRKSEGVLSRGRFLLGYAEEGQRCEPGILGNRGAVSQSLADPAPEEWSNVVVGTNLKIFFSPKTNKMA